MKQFKFTTSIFVSAFLFSAPVFAQATYKGEIMPMNVAIPYNWTGFYGGLNIGGVKDTVNITDNNATSFNATIQQTLNPQFTGGFQVGYRYQLDPTKISGVFGLEFSANFSDANTNKQYGSPFALYQLNSTSTLKDVFLLQLLGGIAADKTLLFIAGGLSWVNITGNVTTQGGAPFFNSFYINKKALGSALGAGIEYAFTEKLSARIKVDVVTPNVYTVSDNTGDRFQITNNIVQGTLGLNYKFG